MDHYDTMREIAERICVQTDDGQKEAAMREYEQAQALIESLRHQEQTAQAESNGK